MKPIVQISLDLVEIPEAIETAEMAMRAGVNWLEAGTPLILAEGMHGVRALRERFSDTPIVADLKTGKPPDGELYDTVSRQLRFYRDILCENNPDHPPVRAEGWYSNGSVVFEAEGPSVLPEAFAAWEASKITNIPMEAKPNDEACGFCEWKAWCPAWIWAQTQGEMRPTGIFRDMIAILQKVEVENPKGEIDLWLRQINFKAI